MQGIKLNIVAIIDSDLQKKENRKILMKKLIAASDPEIFELAKKYTNLIIDWNTLSILYRGAAKYPDYEIKNLEYY